MIAPRETKAPPSGLAAALPPSDPHSERGLVGCCLLDGPAVFDEASLQVAPDDFSTEAARLAWQAMAEARRNGRTFDAVTIAQELAPTLGPDDAEAFTVGCLEAVWSGAQWPTYSRRVAEVATLRRAFAAGVDLVRNAKTEGADAEDVLAQAQAALEAAQQRRLGVELAPTVAEIAPAWLAEATSERPKAWSTGWPSLDSILDGGFRPGQTVVIAARPGVGKSAVLGLLCAHLAGTVPTALFSFEMTKVQILARLIAARSRIDGRRLGALGTLDPHELDAAMTAQAELAGLPLRIDDRHHTADTVRGLARLHARRDGLKIVGIDYLGLITPTETERRIPVREQVVSGHSRQLKRLAMELQGVALVAAQLNRQVEGRADRQPQLADLRESGAIEQDADLVMMLHRPATHDPDADPSELVVYVRKNRGGRCGEVRLKWHGPTFSVTDDFAAEGADFGA